MNQSKTAWTDEESHLFACFVAAEKMSKAEEQGRRRRRHLSSCTLNSVAEAVAAFEENDGLLLCRVRQSAMAKFTPFFSVPEGYYALVQRGGKFEDFRGSSTWPAGLHFGPPWMRVRDSETHRVRFRGNINLDAQDA